MINHKHSEMKTIKIICQFTVIMHKHDKCTCINLTLQCQGHPASRTGHPSGKCSWPSGLGVESSGHGGTDIINKNKSTPQV